MTDYPLTLPRLSIVITERCTLKCKLCAEYSPFYRPQPHHSKEEVFRFLDEIFSVVDSVGDLSFSGGEPLLHRDLWEMIEYAGRYIDRIGRLLILTNGTLLPDREKLLSLRKNEAVWNKLRFHISDYGPELSKKLHVITPPYAVLLPQLLSDCGVDYRIIRYYGEDLFHGGWVDYGDHSRKYHTAEETLAHAQKCAFRRDIFFVVSSCRYLSRCNRTTWRKHIGVLPADTTDIFDLLSPLSREEKREQIRILRAAPVSDSCAFCNGLCEDSERFPPAEQLKNTPESEGSPCV